MEARTGTKTRNLERAISLYAALAPLEAPLLLWEICCCCCCCCCCCDSNDDDQDLR